MDSDTVQYVLKYYSHLMAGKERLLFHHMLSLYKYKNTTGNNDMLTLHYRELGWITANENVLTLLEDGFDKFEMEVAMRIQHQYGNKITFNRCPQCNKLARTPEACQCRYCGHSWRQDNGS